MKKQNQTDPSIVSTLYNLLEGGFNKTQIAEALCIGQNQLNKLLKTENIDYSEYVDQRKIKQKEIRAAKKAQNQTVIPQYEISQITDLYNTQGYGKREIGELMKYTQRELANTFKEINKEIGKLARNKRAADRHKMTNLSRYGIENTQQLISTKEKTKETNLARYGVEHVMQCKSIKSAAEKTNLIKYGYTTPSSSDLVKSKISKSNSISHRGHYQVDLNDIAKHFDECSSYRELANLVNCSGSHIYKTCAKSGLKYPPSKISGAEQIIKDLLDEYNIEYIHQDRSKINPFELDFYLTDLNIAIEVNGIYWHCDINAEDNKHRKKYDLCQEAGITLISFYDSEILYQYDIVKSMILSRCNLSKTIFARKTEIRQLTDNIIKNKFLNENHLQSQCISSINFGLYYNNELVALMTFGKSRFNKSVEYELIRYCNKLNTSVVGGASKLYKHFTKKYNNSVISYSSNRYTTGNLYKQLGFELINETNKSYKYTKDFINLESRNKFMKHKLAGLFTKTFDSNLSERENTKLAGYHRIYDEGSKTWISKDKP